MLHCVTVIAKIKKSTGVRYLPHTTLGLKQWLAY